MLDYKYAYTLFHDGSLALSECESHGCLVDVEHTKREYENTQKKMKEIENEIFSKNIGKYWKSKYGIKASIDSPMQVIHILYEKLGLWASNQPKTKKPSVDKAWLSKINHPLAKKILEYRKWQKVGRTYLLPILREMQEDGRVRFFYPLLFTRSYRSSSGDGRADEGNRSSSGNAQNYPKTPTWLMKIARGCILPDKDCCIYSRDYSGLEVRGACAYHSDSKMIKDLITGHDSHSELAKETFMLSDTQWENIKKELGDKELKNIRQVQKNRFTFALQYNDFFGQIAPSLWNALDEEKLKYSKTMTLKEYLIKKLENSNLEKEIKNKLIPIKLKENPSEKELQRKEYQKKQIDFIKTFLHIDTSKGIDILNKEDKIKIIFMYHIKNVEDNFWKVKHPEYYKWKQDIYKSFLENGYIDSLTGFRYLGNLTKNQINNMPIQGSSFHILLWALIEIQKEFKKRNLKSTILSQIHDQLLINAHYTEINIVDEITKDIMENKTIEHFKWVNVPLPTEAEMTPYNIAWSYETPKDKIETMRKLLKENEQEAYDYCINEIKWNDEEIKKIFNEEKKYLKILENSPKNACKFLVEELEYNKEQAIEITKTELKYLKERQKKVKDESN